MSHTTVTPLLSTQYPEDFRVHYFGPFTTVTFPFIRNDRIDTDGTGQLMVVDSISLLPQSLGTAGNSINIRLNSTTGEVVANFAVPTTAGLDTTTLRLGIVLNPGDVLYYTGAAVTRAFFQVRTRSRVA